MKKKFDSRLAYISGAVFIPIISFILMYDRLPISANITLSIVLFCVVMWISEVAPLSVISLLGLLLSVVFGVNDIKDAFSGFSNPVIFLMIGSFLLAIAINKHGLDRWLSMKILSTGMFSKSIFLLVAGMSILTFALSMWLSNTATTAMMLPVVLGVITVLKDKVDDHKNFSALFLLSIAYAASLGGISTVVGSPTNLVGLGFLSQEGVEVSFFQWSSFTLPAAFLSLLFLLLYIRFKVRGLNRSLDKDYIKQIVDSKFNYQISREGVITGLVFIFTIILWLLPSVVMMLGYKEIAKDITKHIPESGVAVLMSSLLFLIPADFKNFRTPLKVEDLKNIDWDTVILFGGGLSLGKLIEKSGLADIVGKTFSGFLGTDNIYMLYLLLIFLVILATEVMSNTAAAITFIPVVISSLKTMGADITYPVMATVAAASLAFILPVSTPPNAIVYGTKMVPIRTMIETGVILDIVGGVIIFIFLILFRGG